MESIFNGDVETLCQVIDYPSEEES
jgi:hypothetical protein